MRMFCSFRLMWVSSGLWISCTGKKLEETWGKEVKIDTQPVGVHIFDLDLFIVYFTCGVTSCGLDQWRLTVYYTCHLHACKRGGELGVTFSVDHMPDHTNNAKHRKTKSGTCKRVNIEFTFCKYQILVSLILSIKPSNEASGCCG